MSKVFIIDDDESILEAVKLALEMEGHTTSIDKTGKDIVQKIINCWPDVILLDILLSGKDGHEIARNLKNNEITKKFPIIMMSAHPNAKETAKKAGADDFIAKPFDIDDLLKIIKKHTT